MSKEQLHEYIDSALLTTGVGSWGLFEMFKATSEFCRMLLPITGVISFVIYVILNRKKIKEFFKKDGN